MVTAPSHRVRITDIPSMISFNPPIWDPDMNRFNTNPLNQRVLWMGLVCLGGCSIVLAYFSELFSAIGMDIFYSFPTQNALVRKVI